MLKKGFSISAIARKYSVKRATVNLFIDRFELRIC